MTDLETRPPAKKDAEPQRVPGVGDLESANSHKTRGEHTAEVVIVFLRS
jgi:hypothetical protein